MATKSEKKNQKNTLFLMFLLHHNTKKGATIAFFVKSYFSKTAASNWGSFKIRTDLSSF